METEQENTFNIYPNIKKTQTIVKARYDIIDMTLFKSATIRVILFDIDDRQVDIQIFTLDQTNGYSDWAADDTFIIQWLQKQLGVGIFA